MAGKSRGRPKGTGQVIDYAKVRALARYQSLQQELARELGISEQKFCEKLKTDKKLDEAFHGGLNMGRIGGRKLFYDSMFPLYFTFCTNPDCMAITESVQKYYSKCPECGSSGETADGPKFYPPKHDRKPGDGENLRLFAKTYLGMSDRIIHEGNEDKPLAFVSLADFAIAASKAHDRKKQTQKE